MERTFIAQLQTQGYEYLQIKSEADLIRNLRLQLGKLNDYRFSDKEWAQFFKTKIASPNNGIEEKTGIIQEDYIQLLTRDNGETKNIYLIDKQNIHNNSLQVVNQYATEGGARLNRYDVTVLVNGLPLVHIELKRRGVDIKEAFNQINRYQRESFWESSGLFEYVQVFVISNGTYTKYYSNTTRNQHIKENVGKSGKTKKTNNSYEFTSWWADANNRQITDLVGFTKTFFAKHSILNLLTRYCVFTSDKMLLAMRSYQIVATERILGRINVSNNYKTYGKVQGGGYIWHTTGSGKTLTSFKAAQLASRLPYIDKVLFVVDRKDLDYQTMKEYDKFEKGAANSNTSTAILANQLNDSNSKIIITTIQKLANYIKSSKSNQTQKSVIQTLHIVMIFDECHRSQFGDMHTAITKAFKRYHIFGFTGTPIFTVNANASGNPHLKTTEQAFGDKLHTYTIVDAITDKNVLPFRIDYIATMREEENITDEKVWDIDREKALASPQRIENIVDYIRRHFDQKTKRNSFYQLKERRLAGFNSIFATASIDVCKRYYNEFQKQQEDLPEAQRLKIATIFSYGANDEIPEELPDENNENTDSLSPSHKDFLEKAIKDYNAMFKTNYDTTADKFQNYYKDVSQRVKNREIDLLIVVNMFLTGFDATTLNTLWVDKNLRLHGLLQAYSRTNRILNSIKTFGNIVCFRRLEKATNESIALFGDKEAGGVVLLKSYKEYYTGYETEDGKIIRGYEELIAELLQKYPIGKQIIGEQAQKEFIKLYGGILRIKNILSTFDEFADNEILTERDVQDYHSIYIDLYNEFRKKGKGDSENVNDDIVFEMELIKQVEINIDYILELIRKYHEGHLHDKEIVVTIGKAISSSVELRNKKDLIEQFIALLTSEISVDDDWQQFVSEKQKEELNRIIVDENLNRKETEIFVENAFRAGFISETGTAITKLLPPLNPFAPNNQYVAKKTIVIEKLKQFFERFFGVVSESNG
ncbi:MAG: type I restriction endonuclease subunit R [Prevotellaceae bacterium]|nr:type I restriction endonuclease subunit R [Prevotellaceae bacterium]